MKETCKSNEYWLQKLLHKKTVFYDSTYLVINISITLSTDIEQHFHLNPGKMKIEED